MSSMQQEHIGGGNKKELNLVFSAAILSTPAYRIL